MKKAWFFVVVVFFTIAGIAGWLGYNNEQKLSPKPSPTPFLERVQSLPSTQGFPQIPPGTDFVYEGPQKPVPESLTTYRVGPEATTTELTDLGLRLTKQLGFTASPSAATIKGDYVFLLNQGPKSFSLTQNGLGTTAVYRLRLASGVPGVSGAPSLIANNFILQLNLFSSEYAVVPLGKQEAEGENIAVGDVPPPQLNEYGFGLQIENVSVLTPQHSAVWGIVVVDDRGRVRLTRAFVSPTVLTPSGAAKIVSLESAVGGLNSGRGVLVYVSDPNQKHFNVAPSFVRGVISDFSLVYAALGNRFVPAYRFLGTGQTQDGKTQSFEAVVLAVAQP